MEGMEGNMSVPFKEGAGWQTIYRRVVEWQRTIHMRDEVMMFSDHDDDHDPDLPFSRAEAQLEVQKWWWQP
jgi:hypothetical protein